MLKDTLDLALNTFLLKVVLAGKKKSYIQFLLEKTMGNLLTNWVRSFLRRLEINKYSKSFVILQSLHRCMLSKM